MYSKVYSLKHMFMNAFVTMAEALCNMESERPMCSM